MEIQEKMMASYQKFDLESWGRREHFEVFKTYAQNAFSITVEIEITGFLNWVKARRCKFYPAMIHEVAAVLNRYPEFRMAMKDDELIVYDRLNPSYTIPHVQQESFSSIWSEYHEKKEDFLAEYERDLEKYGEDTRYFPRSDTPENVFYISALPWVSFTSFSMQFASLHNLFTPIVTLGKYFERDGKVYIPVAIQLHHAVCDGFHAGRFMTELQKGCHDY
ncbi:CatA-like O-acetyltransferase [Alcaligenes nematophilus]|uniref:CatA-like O-acetyltransferase n=1 Tax=Alcaligenes TaxID=507 RepID=UPI00387EAFA3